MDSSAAPPLLVPYRAVGLVSDGVPFAVQQHGTETFLTTSTGSSFQIWSTHERLRQVFVGPGLSGSVTALCPHEDYTIVCCGAATHIYRRAECIATFSGEHQVSLMSPSRVPTMRKPRHTQ